LGLLKLYEEEMKKLKDCLEEIEISMESDIDINFAECYITIPIEEAQ